MPQSVLWGKLSEETQEKMRLKEDKRDTCVRQKNIGSKYKFLDLNNIRYDGEGPDKKDIKDH